MKSQSAIRRFLTLFLISMLALGATLSLVGSANAQENGATTTQKVPTVSFPQQGPTDSVELEEFLDGLLGDEMETYHIAGAAVAVVKDGRLFFAKGYGYTDLENQVPVDPEQTVFHVGSVGKTFTWTAVMQLVEQGKLDLSADINAYLDFRIPDTYPQPITLENLMTHTSGFEERWLDSVVASDNELIPAREWLVSFMPARVCPPGNCVGYANYNAMLAGYIVARVSGQPYDEYIQEHIFEPLGMVHSTARSPIPPDLRPYVSVGYTYQDGGFQPYPDFTAQPALWPSGAHQASVADMARFMIAHLGDGRYSDATIAGAHILTEATVRQMHNTLYTPDSRLLGAAYGFAVLSDNGQYTLGHEGYFPPMHSQLLLLPDQNLGVFVIYNSADAEILTKQHIGFQRAFFDHYFLAPASEPVQAPADFAARAGRFVGVYRFASSPVSTFQKAGGLVGANTVQILDSGDGALLFSIGGYQWRFVEVEPLYFRQADGPFAMVFWADDRGRIVQLYTDLLPQYSAMKLSWYETPAFNMGLLLACLLLFLSMIPVSLLVSIQSFRSGDRTMPSDGARATRRIILGVCILNLLFILGMVPGFSPPTELLGTQLIVKIILGVGVLSAALTIVALIATALAWKNRYWRITSRVYYTLVTGAAVAFVWFLNYWNLLGWRF